MFCSVEAKYTYKHKEKYYLKKHRCMNMHQVLQLICENKKKKNANNAQNKLNWISRTVQIVDNLFVIFYNNISYNFMCGRKLPIFYTERNCC